MLSSILFNRGLGPEGRGILASSLLISSIGIQLGSLGLSSSNTYFVSKSPLLVNRLFLNSLVIGLICGMSSASVFSIFAYFYSGSMSISLNSTILFVTLISIPVGIVGVLLQGLVLGSRPIRAFNMLETIPKVLIAFIALILFGLNSISPLTATLATLLGYSAICFLGTVAIQPKGHKKRFHIKLFKSSFVYGIKGYIASVLTFIMQKQALIVAQWSFSDDQIGYLSVAQGLFDILYIIPVTMATVLFPRLCRETCPLKRSQASEKIAFLVAITCSIVSLLSWIFAPLITTLLYGQLFTASIPIFRLLIPGFIFLSISTIFMNHLASSGMPLFVLFPPLLSIISFLIGFRLLPNNDPNSAAIASSIGYFVFFIPLLAKHVLQRHHDSRKLFL